MPWKRSIEKIYAFWGVRAYDVAGGVRVIVGDRQALVTLPPAPASSHECAKVIDREIRDLLQ